MTPAAAQTTNPTRAARMRPGWLRRTPAAGPHAQTAAWRTAFASALGLLLLTACGSPSPEPAPGTPVIVVASGGFFGSNSTQIFADGTLISSFTTPGHPPVRKVQIGAPDAYTRAAAVLAAEGARTKRALKPEPLQCLDYGTDQVSATPPIAGFDQASAACPDPAMAKLMDHVLATLAAK